MLDVEGHERSTATLDRRVHSRRLPRKVVEKLQAEKYRVQIIVDGDRVICDIWSSDGKQEEPRPGARAAVEQKTEGT